MKFALDSTNETLEKDVIENNGGHPTPPVAGSQVPMAGSQALLDGSQPSVAGLQVPLVGSQSPLAGKQPSVAGSQAMVRDEGDIGVANVVKERAAPAVDDTGSGQPLPGQKTKGVPSRSVATVKGDVTASTKGVRPPVAGVKRGSTDKVATAARTTCNESGGKTSTGPSKDGTNRAIVEVLDRVDTPQSSSTFAVVDGDRAGGQNVAVGGSRNLGGGSRNVANVNDVGEVTAFSVLPDEERNDDRPCECPNCRKKPMRSSSSKHCEIFSYC